MIRSLNIRKLKWLLLISHLVFVYEMAIPQNYPKEDNVNKLLDSLWVNPTSFFNNTDTNWRLLCSNLQHIDMQKLNRITASVFGGAQAKIKNESTASEGFIGSLNRNSRDKRLKKFNEKTNSDFADKSLHPENKVLLVEGDSWFEFPVFLEDITDNLIKQDNLAVYSLASGGDWAANMVSSHEYQSEYKILHPDVFLVSGGGNDLVGENRLMNFVSENPIPKDDKFLDDYREYVILRQNHKPVPLCNANFCPIEYHLYTDLMPAFIANTDSANVEKIVNGRRYLNKNFYRLLVVFKLEYKILFESLRKLDSIHFDSLKIITQGYDYAIPSSKKKFGIRLLTGNGKWLKEPLEEKGVASQYNRASIVMTMIFDFNEMLIELGKEYPNIYHIDVRGFTHYLEESDGKSPGSYWYDELHPVDRVFAEISKAYIAIINDEMPNEKHVFSVIQFYRKNNKFK